MLEELNLLAKIIVSRSKATMASFHLRNFLFLSLITISASIGAAGEFGETNAEFKPDSHRGDTDIGTDQSEKILVGIPTGSTGSIGLKEIKGIETVSKGGQDTIAESTGNLELLGRLKNGIGGDGTSGVVNNCGVDGLTATLNEGSPTKSWRNKIVRFDVTTDKSRVHVDGGHLVLKGCCGSLEVIGNLQSISHLGGYQSRLRLNGNVESGIDVSGSGKVEVMGGVGGGIGLSHSGAIHIGGDVKGKMDISGSGTVSVMGNVFGVIEVTGRGTVTVHGDVDGDMFVSNGGDIIVHGEQRKGNYFASGFGRIRFTRQEPKESTPGQDLVAFLVFTIVYFSFVLMILNLVAP